MSFWEMTPTNSPFAYSSRRCTSSASICLAAHLASACGLIVLGRDVMRSATQLVWPVHDLETVYVSLCEGYNGLGDR
jgi:hypothetical protein